MSPFMTALALLVILGIGYVAGVMTCNSKISEMNLGRSILREALAKIALHLRLASDQSVGTDLSIFQVKLWNGIMETAEKALEKEEGLGL